MVVRGEPSLPPSAARREPAGRFYGIDAVRTLLRTAQCRGNVRGLTTACCSDRGRERRP